MKKQTLIMSLAALALLVSPLGNMGGLFRVNAEEQQGAELYSVSGNEQGAETVVSVSKVQFDDNSYWGRFSMENTTDSYISCVEDMVLEKDGEILWSGFMMYGVYPGKGYSYSCPLAQHMEETGSYQLRVRVVYWSDEGENYSEWSSSPVVEYTRPERALGSTVGHWDEEQKGVLHYPAVEGAAGYQWRLLKWDEGSSQWVAQELRSPWVVYWEGKWSDGGDVFFDDVRPESPIDAGGEDKTLDFSSEINDCGPGKYCVVVRALSGNINEVANGCEGEMSDVLEISGAGQSAPAPSLIESRLATAQSGSVVKITKEDNVNTLSNADMKELLKKGDVALEMEYTYEGIDYKIYIPAGAAMDNDIPWYGPLYLAQYYGVNNAQAAGVTDYVVVQRGDTLGKIARINGMTVSELAAKNPQIKNPNKIIPGQIIYIN